LIAEYPRLYHMATAGSWDSIKTNGLWTTEQITTSAGLHPDVVEELLTRRRPRSVVIDHPDLGVVSVRDQMPLKMVFLNEVLIDMTVEEWLVTLNNRVFFWLHENRLNRLLGAKQYRNHEQDVLVIDTRSLVEAHHDRVRLAPMNTGSTLFPGAPLRGTGTFAPIAEYDYASMRVGRLSENRVVELAVIDGVHDLADHVVAVQRRVGATILGETRVR